MYEHILFYCDKFGNLSFYDGCKKKSENKATRKNISLETKTQVSDADQQQSYIASTIQTILENKKIIAPSATATTKTLATKIPCSRSNVIEEMEKNISIWIDDKVEQNMTLSQAIIVSKAKTIFNYVQNEEGETSEFFFDISNK